jgi:ABC-type antimicrobial peptide transport system permease subunit
MALGAAASDVLGLVMANAARVIGGGGAIGLTLTLLFGHSVEAFLFGIEPTDPVTFSGAAAVLVVTALAACAVPAWRAVRIDPLEACRRND